MSVRYFQHVSKRDITLRGSQGEIPFTTDEFGRPGVCKTDNADAAAYLVSIGVIEIPALPAAEVLAKKQSDLPDGKYRFHSSVFAGREVNTSAGKAVFDQHGFCLCNADVAEKLIASGLMPTQETLDDMRKRGVAASTLEQGRMAAEQQKKIADAKKEANAMGHEAPNLQAVPEVPEAPTEVPGTPEAPEAPEAPETPGTPEAPEAPETPGTPEAPETPGTPEAPETPGTPEAPETPETPEEVDEEETTGPGLMGLDIKQLRVIAEEIGKKKGIDYPAKANKKATVKFIESHQ